MSRVLENPSLLVATEGLVAPMTVVPIADRDGVHKIHQ